MSDTATLPKYLDVAAAIEAQILKGRWDGGKMPSVRWVAGHHRVSAVTASRALQVLRDKGLIQTIERSGNYRVPPPEAEHWALASHPASGPWNSAASSMIRMGFESLSRRVSMKLDADQLALMPGITPADISQRARAAKGHGVRGVFLQPSRRDDEVKLDETLLACCRDERLPIVLLERNLRGPNRLLETDLVSADDLDGAARCTRHLLELGRKRIALVAGPITSGHDDRLAGYLLAIHSSQCCSRRKSVEHKAIVLGHGEEYPDRDSFAKLIEFIRKQGIDGLVCCADYTAVGLMVELLARGITVPGQVAVAGFDDLPIGNWLSIGVTTYAHPAEGIAEQAVRLMRDRIANPDQAAIKVVVPGRLIVRESTIGKG